VTAVSDPGHGADQVRAHRQQPVLVVMGVTGAGKTTVARILAERLRWDFAEGDDLHPAANVAKMSAGIPLTDEDRWPWLDLVATWIRTHTAAGVPGIITCSALKRIYRDRLSGSNVVFVHLIGARDVIAERLAGRVDHYMPASLLDSQIALLEPTQSDENAVSLAVGSDPAEDAAEIARRLRLMPESDIASK
jgi:gluconokinase